MTLDARYWCETLYLWKDQHMYRPPTADAKSSSNMAGCEVLIGANAANHAVCPSQWKFDLANCDHVIVEGRLFFTIELLSAIISAPKDWTFVLLIEIFLAPEITIRLGGRFVNAHFVPHHQWRCAVHPWGPCIMRDKVSMCDPTPPNQ